MPELYWLPEMPGWADRLRELDGASPADAWPALMDFARSRMSLAESERLARALRRLCGDAPPAGAAPGIRLALLGSSTLDHLASGIRVGGLRRGLWIDVHVGGYGQYAQDLEGPSPALERFAPTFVLLALDAGHLVRRASAEPDAASIDRALDETVDRIRLGWAQARALGAQVLQQTAMPIAPALAGSNEQRIPWSPRRVLGEINARLERAADRDGVDLVRLDAAIERDGLAAWHDPAQWHRAKQEVHPAAAPVYGDLVARVVAARLGRSSKCLVLDLDNTLWGGVIGDDGLHGIVLGQGSAAGEAHLALQAYAKDLARRGVILAVCSKNDRPKALEPFERHPDMVLRASDIACFVANWDDKATNLREIARRLRIGLDALTFVDDNPFERALVRRELPMVAVPELPDDASGYVHCIADGGYFETVALTDDDLRRTAHYRVEAEREGARSGTDLQGYLRDLAMELHWSPFDALGSARILQLINKSNQFNLTTRRYGESQVEALIDDRGSLALQMRLIDRFSDNGMISVVIGKPARAGVMELDTWLMSCRVLGRGVERAVLNLLAERARDLGVDALLGVFRPTSRNGMVADHYRDLGFAADGVDEDGTTFWTCDLRRYVNFDTPIAVKRAVA